MTQPTYQTQSQSPYAWTIKAQWGSGHVVYLSSYDVPFDINGQTYEAVPKLSITQLLLRGGTEDENISFRIPEGIEPFDTMSLGRAHADVMVTIGEVDPTDTSTHKEIWFGHVAQTSRYPDGLAGVLQVVATGIYASLNQVPGIAATSECQWIFGGPGCELDAASHAIDGVVAAMNVDDQRRVRVNFSPATPDFDNQRWRRGYLQRDGLRVQIRKVVLYDVNQAIFWLSRVPPADWLSQTVTCQPGCDGEHGTCMYWNNESQFGGFGLAIPARNPVFELGG